MWTTLSLIGLTMPLLTPYIQSHAGESYLLHRKVDGGVLVDLRVYDRATAEFRAATVEERPLLARPITVVHLWADYCAPCVEELPVLGRLAQRLEGKPGDAIRVLFITETIGSGEMQRFLLKHPRALPANTTLYQDAANTLFEGLRAALPASRSPQLPMTLIIDENQVIRQAFVGSILTRMTELIDGIERLRRSVEKKPPQDPQSPPAGH